MADWSESWSRRVWQDGELIEEHTGSTSGRVSTQDDGAIDLTLPAPSFQDLTHLLGPGLSLALDLTPGVGELKGLVEAVTGKDLITGEDLAAWERMIGIIPYVGDAGKILNSAGDIARAAEKGYEFIQAAAAVGKLEEAATTVEKLRAVDEALAPLSDAPEILRARQAIEEALATGGRINRQMDGYYRHIEYAPKAYEEIRQADDVAVIAQNIGWSEQRVQRVKDHLFYREHQLDERVRHFDPDPDIADAWKRLQTGKHSQEDLRLMHHEYFESRFEGIFNTDYRTAHDATNRSGRTWNPQSP